MTYGSGAFSGEGWLNDVTLALDLVAGQQSIGIANWAEGVDGFDGMFGLRGPVDLIQSVVNNTSDVPTVLDNPSTQKTISQEVFGALFVPASESQRNGSLTFGGYDDSTMTSAVNSAPLTQTDPAATFWGINQSISCGNTTIQVSAAGIVNTGITLVLIPSGEWG